MSVRAKKFHPALKHGGYSATGLLPGEDPADFEKLHQDLIAELQPDGPTEKDIVATITRLIWRKQNLDTFRIAESARTRYSAIRSEKVPPTPSFDYLNASSVAPDPAEVQAGEEAAEAQARKGLGNRYEFVEMGEQRPFLGCLKTSGSWNVWTL